MLSRRVNRVTSFMLSRKSAYVSVLLLVAWQMATATGGFKTAIYELGYTFFKHVQVELIVFFVNMTLIAIVLRAVHRKRAPLWHYQLVAFVVVWCLFLQCKPYDLDANKFTVLQHIPQEYRPRMHWLGNSTDLGGLALPVVFKPVTCTGVGRGVHVCNSTAEVAANAVNSGFIQEFVPYRNEVGVLFERGMFGARGRIVSLVQKHFPRDVFTGVCARDNVTCEDLTPRVTESLVRTFQRIVDSIPGFNVGRFDVRFRDLDSLWRGEALYVLEVNGTMGFDLRKTPLAPLFTFLIVQRWWWYRLLMGVSNTLSLSGFSPPTLVGAMHKTFLRGVQCRDWDIFSV